MEPLLLGILAYVAVQLAIGVWVSRRIRTEDDYLLAGRSLGPALATASVFATWFGAETCVSATGSVHRHGVGHHSVEPFAYGLCLVAMGLLVAAPLWRRGITTIADLFRQSFDGRVEALAAAILVPTSVFWAAAQVRAFGGVLQSASSIDLATGITIAAGIAIVYTVFGGLLADVYTDAVQGSALLIGLFVILWAAVADAGGPAAAIDAVTVASVPPEPWPGWMDVAEAWALPILGSLTAQEVLQRSFAARSAPLAKKAAIAGGLLYISVGLMPVALGLLAVGAIPADVEGDQVLAAMAAHHLPSIGYVLFAGALVSAILSTVDSALLVASSLVTRNLLLRGREASQQSRVRLARLGVLVGGVIAWRMALGSESVFALVENASGFGSAGVLVCVVMALRRGPDVSGRATGALGALTAGVGVWCLAAYVVDGWPWPFLSSLAAALLGYAAGHALERRR